MKRGVIWIVLTCIMVISLVLASCSTSTTTSTQASTSTTTVTSTSPKTTSTTTKTAQLTTTSTASTGNWWDSLGKPQYGGTITLRMPRDFTCFDPDTSPSQTTLFNLWMEELTADDWTLNPSVFDYKIGWRPSDYVKGDLAETWEMTDPSTYVVHLHQGIHWQNIPPANGRELTADDVVFHYDRMFGWGAGYTKPAPAFAVSNFQNMASVTATDKYTVVFSWKISCPELIMETMQGSGGENTIENPDAVKQWGDVTDWHHAIGTGPFILTDFVSGSSAMLIKNSSYWAHDERYPANQLPYVDAIRYLIIPDDATAVAAMRTGKIDAMDGMPLTTAQLMQKTNPEILQIPTPLASTCAVVPMNNKVPYTDIRVREALQMAIDLPTIAQTYYGGAINPNPSSLTSTYEAGWGFPYSQWSQDLKNQYAYNPTAAKQLLAAAGYPNGFNTDIVVESGVDLNVVQIVKSYFAAIGVNMDIRTMDVPSWVSFVRTRHQADALVEIAGGGDPIGLTYEPMRQLNRFVTGYAANWGNVSDPTFDKFLPQAMALTNLDDIKKVVTQANQYVAEQHFAISLLQPMVYSFCEPWLKGYNGQFGSTGGLISSPQIAFFYLSRFWIDQNMKKSMGH